MEERRSKHLKRVDKNRLKTVNPDAVRICLVLRRGPVLD